MIRVFDTGYAPSGAGLFYGGERAVLDIVAETRLGEDWTEEDLAGRTFEQRIVDGDGEQLLAVEGETVQAEDGAWVVRFEIPAAKILEWLGDAAAKDLAHLVIETPMGDPLLPPSPFRLRKAAA